MGDVLREQHEAEMCPRCECCSVDTSSEPCWVCGGDGFFDCYDEDPINYAPGEEFEDCFECGGRGRIVVDLCSCDENGKHAAPDASRQPPSVRGADRG